MDIFPSFALQPPSFECEERGLREIRMEIHATFQPSRIYTYKWGLPLFLWDKWSGNCAGA